MSRPLLSTKLHIPALRPDLVPRPRLVACLNEGLRSPKRLILISAPAGFGKTTLLGEWVQSLESGRSAPLQVAWISLDAGDNDPARFSAYLSAAIMDAVHNKGQARMNASAQTGSILHESHLISLINQVAVLPQAFVLILDDYHLIISQEIHDAVAFMVDHLAENMHLILATRADPPLPLPRLRARGHLTELRQRDLRFTEQEAADFLNHCMGLGLSKEDVSALEARTEGWIAGLQMAALSLQGQGQDPTHHTRSRFIRAFTGSHRYILDYLVEEVLQQQPPALQDFLLKTSILERLTGSLCDTVLGNGISKEEGSTLSPLMPDLPDSQSILEYLEAANLFILPLDLERQWYRYHRLFADLLQQHLIREQPDALADLHRRASAWHEQQGLFPAAIDHALAAHDFERAAILIEENVETTFMRSEVRTFLNWVDKLPDEEVRNRPSLCFFHAWALLMSGRSLDEVEQRLRDITGDPAHAQNSTMSGRITALHAYLMLFRADMGRATLLAEQALEQLSENDRFLRSIVAWILSLARLSDGSLQDGRQELEEVARISMQIGNPLIAVAAICHQARLQMRMGQLHRAQMTLDRALQLATDSQGRQLPIASEALIGMGELELEWNNLETAADNLTKSIDLAMQWSEMAAFDAYLPLARVRVAQGDVEGAQEVLDTARLIAQRSQATELDDIVADLHQALFFTTQGDIEGALGWAEKRGLLADTSPGHQPGPVIGQDYINTHLLKYEHLVLTRLFIRQDRPADALNLLEPLLEEARELGRVDLIIKSLILNALACQLAGDDSQAIKALAEALSLAEPAGYLRIFLDEGEPMARLLRQAATRGIAPGYVSKLLAAFTTAEYAGEKTASLFIPAQPLVEPLSERELEVLRLMATGMSNPEIASELVVAVSTVRTHCKNIYGKLNVHKRWDAVLRAQELGLI